MARYITWTPATGAPLVLTDPAAGYRVLAAGTRGLWAPPYRMSSERYAGLSGSVLTAVEADERDVGLGVTVIGATADEFRARWRALVRALRPTAGDGTLTVTDEGGFARTLACRYAGGLEGDATDQSSGVLGTAVVRLVAHDPWWYGPEQTIDVGLAAPASFFPMPPLVLAASTVQGTFTVDLSDSDAPTYPAWTVTGPGTTLTLTNTTTGATIQATLNLGDGEYVLIDTRPGQQSIRRATAGTTSTEVTRRNVIGNPELTTTTAVTAVAATVSASSGGLRATTTASATTVNSAYVYVQQTSGSGQTSRAAARPGDRVAWRVEVTNPGTSALTVHPRLLGYSWTGSAWAGNNVVLYGEYTTVEPGATRVAEFATTIPTSATATEAILPMLYLLGEGATTAAGAGRVYDLRRAAMYVGADAPDPGEVVPYIHGDMTDTATVAYSWEGAAGNSATVETATRATSFLLGANIMSTLATDPAMWPLLDGVNTVSALLTNAGPASRIRGTYRARYSGI